MTNVESSAVPMALFPPCYSCDGEIRSAIPGCGCGCDPYCYSCDGTGEERDCDECGEPARIVDEFGQFCGLACAGP